MNSFNVMSLKTARNFGGATVPEKTGSRERKQKQRPLGEQEVAARCLRWPSARGLLSGSTEGGPGPQAGVRGHRGGGGFCLGCGLGKVGGYVGLGTLVKPP